MPPSLHVGLVYGGASSEHDISVLSARNVLADLVAAGHRVTPLFIARDGRWHVDADHAALADGAGERAPAVFAPADPRGPVRAAGAAEPLGLDAVVPMLHGQNGEDGRVQGFLHTLGLPFVGPDVLGSALCMDKEAAKRMLAHAGLPVTPSRTVRAGEAPDWDALTAELGTPLFVKPANSGSSVGVSRVETAAELDAALALAFAYDRKVLVEQAVDGREIECAVLGNADADAAPEASVPGEVVATTAFYDYDAKYVDADASRMEVPADLPPETAARVREIALRAFTVLECEGLARVDVFVVPGPGADRVLINEVNTIPGFTARSMYPVMWAHGTPAGGALDGPALADRLVRLAIARHARDAAIKTSR